MFKRFILLIIFVSFNAIFAMDSGLDPEGPGHDREKMEIDDFSSTSIIPGKRKRDENDQSENLERQAKKDRIDFEENSNDSKSEESNNLLQSLPVELQLMILSFVVKNNNSIGQCFKNLYSFAQVNKESLNLVSDHDNSNYLLKCIACNASYDDIIEILLNPEKQLIKSKLADFIYFDLFLNKDYMLKFFKNLVEKDLKVCLEVIDVFFKNCLISIVKSQESNKIANKILAWLEPVCDLIISRYKEIYKIFGFKLDLDSKFPNFILDGPIDVPKLEITILDYAKIERVNRFILSREALNRGTDTDKIIKDLLTLRKTYLPCMLTSKFIIELLAYPAEDAKNEMAIATFKFWCNFVDIVKLLISRDFDWKPFLCLIFKPECLEVVNLLIGLEANSYSYLIHYCILSDNSKLLEYLLNKGAKISASNIIDAAISRPRHEQILELLLKQNPSDSPNLDQLKLLAVRYLSDINFEAAFLHLPYSQNMKSHESRKENLIAKTIKKFVPNWDPNKPFNFDYKEPKQ